MTENIGNNVRRASFWNKPIPLKYLDPIDWSRYDSSVVHIVCNTLNLSTERAINLLDYHNGNFENVIEEYLLVNKNLMYKNC